MKTDKQLTGEPFWGLGAYDGASRWLSPLSVDGETTGMTLYVDSFPRMPILNFHIVLNYEVCVSRLDFSEIDKHRNHVVRRIKTPPSVQLGWVDGPHFHRWDENKVLFVPGPKTKELEFAIALPDNVRTFDAAFRYFCDHCNIKVAANQMPSLPPRDTLL